MTLWLLTAQSGEEKSVMRERTVGGKLLKRLREEKCGFTQEELYLRDVIAQKTLSQIETGKTERPERDTLDTLLDAYNATFNEAHEILKSYGYVPNYPLPNAEDIAVVKEKVQPVLNAAPVPAYLVDFITRLHGYNDLFFKLLGLDHDAMATLEGQAIWKVWYEERMTSGEPLDHDLLEDVRQMRQRMAVYAKEPWFEGFIHECGEPFVTYWEAAGEVIQEEALSLSPFVASLMTPVSFHLPDVSHPLEFFVNEDELGHDERFRIIYLIPTEGDMPTMRWVTAQRSGS